MNKASIIIQLKPLAAGRNFRREEKAVSGYSVLTLFRIYVIISPLYWHWNEKEGMYN